MTEVGLDAYFRCVINRHSFLIAPKVPIRGNTHTKDMAEVDIPTVVTALLTIATVAVPGLAVYVAKAKGKLSAFRAFVVELDDDLKDNHLSNDEYARLVKKFKNLVA